MASKQVVFAPQAERDIKGLSKQNQKIVISALELWSRGEGKHDVEKIKSQPSFYRMRVGCFRLFYYPLSSERVVLLMIRDRKDAYKNLETLPQRLEAAIRKLKIVGG